ncbi:hypothetical protein Nmel_001783, partial [Mimus melanotis]
ACPACGSASAARTGGAAAGGERGARWEPDGSEPRRAFPAPGLPRAAPSLRGAAGRAERRGLRARGRPGCGEAAPGEGGPCPRRRPGELPVPGARAAGWVPCRDRSLSRSHTGAPVINGGDLSVDRTLTFFY